MGSTVTIRTAEAKDIKSIFDIESKSFGNEAFNLRQFKYLVKSPSSLFQVALVDNQVAGYLVSLIRKNSKQLRMYSLAVNEDFRGQGIAQKLIDYIKQVARDNGYVFVTLEVREHNQLAIELYKKNGFVQIAFRLNYYALGEHALIMRCPIYIDNLQP